MATGTQAAPTSASKVEKSAIMAGETPVYRNVGNTDNSDNITEENDAVHNTTPLRIAAVGLRKLITGITVAPATATKAAAETQQLTNTFAPTDAYDKTVTYVSSDEEIATVSATGLVTAVATGEATITVTTNDQKKTGTSVITVS